MSGVLFASGQLEVGTLHVYSQHMSHWTNLDSLMELLMTIVAVSGGRYSPMCLLLTDMLPCRHAPFSLSA